jgi:hypothetical protein
LCVFMCMFMCVCVCNQENEWRLILSDDGHIVRARCVVYLHVHAHVHVFVYVYVHVCVCVCVYTYMQCVDILDLYILVNADEPRTPPPLPQIHILMQ